MSLFRRLICRIRGHVFHRIESGMGISALFETMYCSRCGAPKEALQGTLGGINRADNGWWRS